MTDRIDLRSLASPELLEAYRRSNALDNAITMVIDHGNRERAGYAEQLEALERIGEEADAEFQRLKRECFPQLR